MQIKRDHKHTSGVRDHFCGPAGHLIIEADAVFTPHRRHERDLALCFRLFLRLLIEEGHFLEYNAVLGAEHSDLDVQQSASSHLEVEGVRLAAFNFLVYTLLCLRLDLAIAT